MPLFKKKKSEIPEERVVLNSLKERFEMAEIEYPDPDLSFASEHSAQEEETFSASDLFTETFEAQKPDEKIAATILDGTFGSLRPEDEEMVIANVRKKMQDRFKDRITKERHSKDFKFDIRNAIEKALMDEAKLVRTTQDRDRLTERIYNLIMGLGPLENLFKDGYSEIMVSRYDKVFVEEKGKMKLSNVCFGSEKELRDIVDQMLNHIGRSINIASPTVDGRLEDGSRFNVVIPPIAVDGTQLTIRRFPERIITEQDYLNFGSLNQTILDFLKISIEAKFNVVVSGGTGSGKTSLLNLLSNFLRYEPGLAVVTIEDSCELKINHPNVRRYETRSANQSGEGRVSSRDMVKNSLRARPDVVIIGEIRDGTMADFLRMATSGHDGCLTTVHNNSPQELESTVQVLFQMAEDYNFTEAAISRLYCSAVDLIVQIKRCSDHVRRITHVSHVVGYGKRGAKLLGIPYGDPRYDPNECYVEDIFVWQQWGQDEKGTFLGDYMATGYVPKELIQKAADHGINVDLSIFERDPRYKAEGGDI